MTTTKPGTTIATMPAPAQGDAERSEAAIAEGAGGAVRGRPGRRMLAERHDAVLQVLMGKASVDQVAARMGVHPATIEQWRDQALAGMSEALLRGALGQTGASWCVLVKYNASAQQLVRLSTQQAAGNIDPPYGSYFPADAKVPANAQLASQAGRPLIAQPGWGGGPNVTLGPQPAGVLWGVHTTPFTGPEIGRAHV